MPGGRLTHEDRRQIAAGLAEGLDYAEIARRLDRPTSTVSREVARNGGSERYRAEPAERATQRRARRSTTARPSESTVAGADGGRSAELSRFVEHFAELIVRTGLPRTAARVLVLLSTTDAGSLTAAELVQYLRVSPASVSKAIAYLEGLALARRERDPGRRRERHVIGDDVLMRAWTASARSNTLWADAARHGAMVLGATTPAGARLEQMARFFARLSDDMAKVPAEAVATDVLTVLAALVYAGAPRTVEQLADALGWPIDRAASALDSAERHPQAADPVVVRRTAPDGFTIDASPLRLTAAQREALRRRS